MRDPETERLLQAVRNAVAEARRGGVTIRACIWDATVAAVDGESHTWPSKEARHTAEAACRAVDPPTVAATLGAPQPDAARADAIGEAVKGVLCKQLGEGAWTRLCADIAAAVLAALAEPAPSPVTRIVYEPSDWEQLVADESRLAAMQHWLQANGIEPQDVPATSVITIEDSPDGAVIRYSAWLRDERGRLLADPDDESKGAATEERTAPLLTEPPADRPASGRIEGEPPCMTR